VNVNGRSHLLESYGRFYGDEHFAIAFTAGTEGENAKRVVTAGWDKSKPLATGDYGAGLIAERGQERNIAIVLRPSNLVVLECDSEQDLVAIRDLSLPETLTVRSSEPYKQHFYFRPPEELGTLPYVAFRFESGKVTADSGRYFLAPPSIHPSGAQYAFLPDHGPGDTDIAELPEQLYRQLVERAQRETSEQRERIQVDPEAKIYAGQRRETIFRFACMLRRWGRPYEAILEECQRFNQERCEPPVAAEHVVVQVKGAMKKDGDQELVEQPAGPPPIIFESLRSFLARDLPKSEALIGVTRDGTNLLPRYGWVMPWGREGSGKTSVLVDLIFHACAGIDWIGYPIKEQLRLVVIINEGVPGGLQDKLEQKTERWEHDKDAVLDNLGMYVSPWGEFTFKNDRMVEHARSYIDDFGADYIVCDPLHTLGAEGAGAPTETEDFKHRLRSFGLWQDIGVITAHHSNKAGMVSGDWGRHPDTLIHLEKDGKRPATKFTLQKARPADPQELGNPFLLEWETMTLSYKRVDIDSVKVGDDELLERIKQTIANFTEPPTMNDLKEATEGNAARIAKVAKEALERGELANLSTAKGRYRFSVAQTSPAHEDSEESMGQNDPQSVMNTGIQQVLDAKESLEQHPKTGQTIPRFPPSRREGEQESEPLGLTADDIPF
jgi:hypothetical protein